MMLNFRLCYEVFPYCVDQDRSKQYRLGEERSSDGFNGLRILQKQNFSNESSNKFESFHSIVIVFKQSKKMTKVYLSKLKYENPGSCFEKLSFYWLNHYFNLFLKFVINI